MGNGGWERAVRERECERDRCGKNGLGAIGGAIGEQQTEEQDGQPITTFVGKKQGARCTEGGLVGLRLLLHPFFLDRNQETTNRQLRRSKTKRNSDDIRTTTNDNYH